MNVELTEYFGTIPSFNTLEEEVFFWQSKAREMKIKLVESREELDEFQENSRELETELEAQLHQEEERSRALSSTLTRCLTENGQLKEKLEAIQSETHREIDNLQSDLCNVYSVRDRLSKYVRELEQQNDDLERVKRAMVVSLEDFESRLNQALERNAFLESELDEKESLRDMVQRLKDESRDLRQELAVKQRLTANSPSDPGQHHQLTDASPAPLSAPPADTPGKGVDKNLSYPIKPSPSKPTSLSVSSVDGAAGAVAHSPLVDEASLTVPGGCAMSTGTRIVALNIVGDLLRTVAAMESRLATCKSYVRDSSSGKLTKRGAGSRQTARVPACSN